MGQSRIHVIVTDSKLCLQRRDLFSQHLLMNWCHSQTPGSLSDVITGWTISNTAHSNDGPLPSSQKFLSFLIWLICMLRSVSSTTLHLPLIYCLWQILTIVLPFNAWHLPASASQVPCFWLCVCTTHLDFTLSWIVTSYTQFKNFTWASTDLVCCLRFPVNSFTDKYNINI